jgi:phospholipase C
LLRPAKETHVRARHGGLCATYVLAVAAAVVLTGCTGPGSSPPPTGVGASSAADVSTTVEKILVVVVENHSFAEMQSEMPFTSSLAAQYGYADDFVALAHPSLPNYLAMLAGDTLGVTDDDPPPAHPLSGPSVFGEAVRQGSTATVYVDAMQSACQQKGGDGYAVRHNPWLYFVDERSLCTANDVPLDQLAADVGSGDLPAVGMLVPDVCHDAHDCPLAQADTWISNQVGMVMDGPDFASGRLALVITADEDDHSDNNRVLTVVAHPGLEHAVVHEHLDHYSLSRAYAEVAGVRPLRQAAQATSLLQAFGLKAG